MQLADMCVFSNGEFTGDSRTHKQVAQACYSMYPVNICVIGVANLGTILDVIVSCRIQIHAYLINLPVTNVNKKSRSVMKL